MMSPDEVRACYRLYAAYYTSCGISPYRRMLASLSVQLRHSIFKESFAQISWAELKDTRYQPLAEESERKQMRQLVLAVGTILTVATISPTARANMVGAAAGAGTGLLIAGPVGAVAGRLLGGFRQAILGSANWSRCVLGRQRLPSPLFI